LGLNFTPIVSVGTLSRDTVSLNLFIIRFFIYVGGVELVSCTGDHGHYYPFGDNRVEGTKILWQFMKAHPLN
jgi:hypothetical protein